MIFVALVLAGCDAGAPRAPHVPDGTTPIGTTPSGDSAPDPTVGAPAWSAGRWGDPGDRAGQALAAADLDGDGVDDLVVGGLNAAWLALGPILGASALAATSDAAIEVGGGRGVAVAAGGDLDLDGVPDLALADPGAGVWIVPATVRGAVDVAAAGALLAGPELAGSLAAVADVDGAGASGLLVGAASAGPAGLAAVFVRAPAAGGALVEVGVPLLLPPQHGLDLAWDLAVAAPGDVDGDGRADLLVGSHRCADWQDIHGDCTEGAAYLVSGAPDAPLDLHDADTILVGEQISDRAGASVAGAGDVDGDGRPDLLVGAPQLVGPGRVYLVAGPPARGAVGLGQSEAVLVGGAQDRRAGGQVAGLGDVDGDGYADVAVALDVAPGASGFAGAAVVVYGPAAGAIALEDQERLLVGGAAGWPAGVALAALRGADGRASRVVGAPLEGDGAGSVWLAVAPAP